MHSLWKQLKHFRTFLLCVCVFSWGYHRARWIELLNLPGYWRRRAWLPQAVGMITSRWGYCREEVGGVRVLKSHLYFYKTGEDVEIFSLFIGILLYGKKKYTKTSWICDKQSSFHYTETWSVSRDVLEIAREFLLFCTLCCHLHLYLNELLYPVVILFFQIQLWADISV